MAELWDGEWETVADWLKLVFDAAAEERLDSSDAQGEVIEAIEHALKGRDNLMAYIARSSKELSQPS